MAAADRASMAAYDYQGNYSYDQYRRIYLELFGQEEYSDNHRIKRTRERPKPNKPVETAPQGLTAKELLLFIMTIVVIGLLLIGTLVLNAYAVSIQWNINSLTNSNAALEDQIDVLSLQIDSSTSIEQIESYAMDELEMSYPTSSQSVYISEDATLIEGFAAMLKQRAYE